MRNLLQAAFEREATRVGKCATRFVILMLVLAGVCHAAGATVFTDSLSSESGPEFSIMSNTASGISTGPQGMTLTAGGGGDTEIALSMQGITGNSTWTGDCEWKVTYDATNLNGIGFYFYTGTTVGQTCNEVAAQGSPLYDTAGLGADNAASFVNWAGTGQGISVALPLHGTIYTARVGNTIDAYLNGIQISSFSGQSAPLSYVTLQAFTPGAYSGSVTFSNFQFAYNGSSLPLPEPMLPLTLLGGLLAVAVRAILD